MFDISAKSQLERQVIINESRVFFDNLFGKDTKMSTDLLDDIIGEKLATNHQRLLNKLQLVKNNQGEVIGFLNFRIEYPQDSEIDLLIARVCTLVHPDHERKNLAFIFFMKTIFESYIFRLQNLKFLTTPVYYYLEVTDSGYLSLTKKGISAVYPRYNITDKHLDRIYTLLKRLHGTENKMPIYPLAVEAKKRGAKAKLGDEEDLNFKFYKQKNPGWQLGDALPIIMRFSLYNIFLIIFNGYIAMPIKKRLIAERNLEPKPKKSRYFIFGLLANSIFDYNPRLVQCSQENNTSCESTALQSRVSFSKSLAP